MIKTKLWKQQRLIVKRRRKAIRRKITGKRNLQEFRLLAKLPHNSAKRVLLEEQIKKRHEINIQKHHTAKAS